MRKILFRGRDHAGKWRKGSLITRIEESQAPETAVPYVVHYIKGQDFEGEEHEVDPETIEQLAFPATGRHPDIWEGDIIEDKYGCHMVVLFDYQSRGFKVLVRSKTSVCCERLDEVYLHFKFKNHGAKVVENIYDE